VDNYQWLPLTTDSVVNINTTNFSPSTTYAIQKQISLDKKKYLQHKNTPPKYLAGLVEAVVYTLFLL
jgi:hypothetical protein